MSAPRLALLTSLQTMRRHVVRRLAARSALTALRDLCAAALILALAGALFPLPAVVRVLSGLAAVAVLGVAVFRVARPLSRRPTLRRLAMDVDELAPQLKGAVAPAADLARQPEDPQPRTSSELADAAIAQAAQAVGALDPQIVARKHVRALPVRSAAAAAVVLLAATLVSPDGVGQALVHLARPGDVREPEITFDVQPGDVSVKAGAPVTIRAIVHAPAGVRLASGQKAPTLWLRARGGDWTTVAMPTRKGAAFVATLPRVDQDAVYHVALGKFASHDFTVRVLAEATLLAAHVEYTPPAYSGLPAEKADQTTGDLSGLEGTTADVTYHLSLPVASAHVQLDTPGAAPIPLVVSGDGTALRGTIRLMQPAHYRLVVAPKGSGPHADPSQTVNAQYAIAPTPDAPPTVAIVQPDDDAQLPVDQTVTLATEATDDFGLREIAVVAWKDGAEASKTRRVLAPLHGEREDRRAGAWSLSGFGLTPGQSVLYYVEAVDNDAVRGGQVTRSAVRKITFPTLADLMARAADTHEESAKDLSQLLDQGKSVQQDLQKMANEARGSQSTSWEDKKSLEDAIAQQQQIAEGLDKTADQLGKMLDKMSEQSQINQDLLNKVAEVQKLVQGLNNQDLKKAIERLQKAMQALDKNQVQQAMANLQQNQQDMLKALERTIKLLEKIQREERVDAMAQKLEDLAKQQQDLADQMKKAASKDEKQQTADDQKKLADEAKKAQDEMKQLAEDIKQDSPDAAKDMQQTQQEMEQQQTPSTMDRAAELMKQNDQNGAQKKANQAAQQLNKLAQNMRNAQKKMNDSENAALGKAMEALARDMLQVSQGEERLSQPNPGATTQDLAEQQATLNDEAQRLAETLQKLAQKSPYISPQLSAALGKSMQSGGESQNNFERGNRNGGERKAGESGAALNAAVAQLLQAKDSQCQGGNPGGSKALMQKLNALGQMQSQLNAEGQQMMQGQQGGQRLSPSQQGQLARMAAQQEMIRQGMQDLAKQAGQAGDQLGHLGDIAKQMEQVQRDLASGKLTPQVAQQQQKILSRMLDAQKAMDKRDFKDTRTAQSGVNVNGASPGAIPASALREKNRITIDMLRAKSDPVPPEYRGAIDAYLRALGAPSK